MLWIKRDSKCKKILQRSFFPRHHMNTKLNCKPLMIFILLKNRKTLCCEDKSILTCVTQWKKFVMKNLWLRRNYVCIGVSMYVCLSVWEKIQKDRLLACNVTLNGMSVKKKTVYKHAFILNLTGSLSKNLKASDY